MGKFGDILKIWGPRVLGALAGGVAAKIGEKTGTVVDPATITGLGLIVYSAVHKATSSKFNPGDAAEGRISTAEKIATDTGTAVVPEVKPSK